MKGKGNSIGFEARMYDPRIGRWFNIDPLAHKYPGISPYVYVGNKPIYCKETDGRDYIVVVDKVNKTITIKATLYVDVADENSKHQAQKAANFWNNLSSEYALTVKEQIDGKRSKVDYQINFDIEVEEVFTAEDCPTEYSVTKEVINGKEVNVASRANKGANSFIVLPEGEFFKERAEDGIGNPNALGFVKPDGRSLRLLESLTEDQMKIAGSHEVGHLLGLSHWPETLMNKSYDGAGDEVNSSMIKSILGRAGVVKKFVDPGSGGHGTVVDPSGKEMTAKERSQFSEQTSSMKKNKKD